MKRLAWAMAATALLVACSAGGVDPGAPDGEIDCEATIWTMTVDRPDSGGEQTPFAAMEMWADAGYANSDHTIHVVTARTATVVIDGAEVALITVEELADETFSMIRVEGCRGFEPA